MPASDPLSLEEIDQRLQDLWVDVTAARAGTKPTIDLPAHLQLIDDLLLLRFWQQHDEKAAVRV